MQINDTIYRELLLSPIRTCKHYFPKFGANDQETSLDEFQRVFGADPLYAWIGLDDPLIYAAHKAAGGITSIYRQLGIGSERLVRRIIMDNLNLTESQVSWSYEVIKEDGTKGVLKLDAYVPIELLEADAAARVKQWIRLVGTNLGIAPDVTDQMKGIVMEVRQGYKSADSKRQNADLRFAVRAYNEHLLPLMLVLSTQVSQTVVRRYSSAQFSVLKGTLSNDSSQSTYTFLNEVIGYDLAAFFERNKTLLRAEVRDIVATLLSPTDKTN